MRFVTPVLKHFVFPALSRSGYLRHSAGSEPAVVTYHGVFPPGYRVRNAALDGNLVNAESLRRQLYLLRRAYHPITPQEFLSWCSGELALPPRSILLTCDDALRNSLTEMVPILREMGLSCLFFATGASTEATPAMLWYEELYLMLLEARLPARLNIPEAGIDIEAVPPAGEHSCWWNLVERLSQFDRDSRRGFLDQTREQLALACNWSERFHQDSTLAARFLTLDRAGLLKLAEAGMTIGAHSLSHPILARMPEELAWREISESRRILEETLGNAVWAFAYPFGNQATVTAREQRLAEQAGFVCGFMNVEGGPGVGGGRFGLPRVHVTAGMGLAEFEAHISGFYHSLRDRLLGGSEAKRAVGE